MNGTKPWNNFITELFDTINRIINFKITLLILLLILALNRLSLSFFYISVYGLFKAIFRAYNFLNLFLNLNNAFYLYDENMLKNKTGTDFPIKHLESNENNLHQKLVTKKGKFFS